LNWFESNEGVNCVNTHMHVFLVNALICQHLDVDVKINALSGHSCYSTLLSNKFYLFVVCILDMGQQCLL